MAASSSSIPTMDWSRPSANRLCSNPISIVDAEEGNEYNRIQSRITSQKDRSQGARDLSQRLMLGAMQERKHTKSSSRAGGVLHANSLPGAPLLASRSRNTFGDDNDGLPPISLAEQAYPPSATAAPHQQSQQYGSLRESQVEGRFLDGPSSYRDKQSGQIICSLPRHHPRMVRKSQEPPFTVGPIPGSSISSRLIPPLAGMSIGERMATSAAPSTKKGALDDLLNKPLQAEGGNASTAPTLQDTMDDDYEDDDNFLSTSLTGLEILQQHRSSLLMMNKFASDPTRSILPPPPSSITTHGNPPSRLPSQETLRSLCSSPTQHHPFDMDD